MATFKGIGTTRYGWQGRQDGTAEATVWFVVFFFPVIPLRREHLRVLNSGIRRSSVLSVLGALAGAGVGFQTEIELLRTMPISPVSVLRTYIAGFVIVPLTTLGPPMLLIAGAVIALQKFGMEPNAVLSKAAPIVGIAALLWIGCVVARICDRSAGRHHVAPLPKQAEPLRESDRPFGW